jgi:hypothetical protein
VEEKAYHGGKIVRVAMENTSKAKYTTRICCIEKADFRIALLSGLVLWFAAALAIFLGPEWL